VFDTETTRLIQQAAPLDGLDLSRLPEFLTQAYAQVVAARLEVVKHLTGQQVADWADIHKLRRLAETYEGLAIFLPREDPHRPSCAFVAGSAYYTLSQARQVQAHLEGTGPDLPSLSTHGIGTGVAACLLFLMAEQQADAAETAKLFRVPADSPILKQLLDGIAALALGNGSELQRVATAHLVDAEGPTDYVERAASALWKQLAQAVRSIARQALGMNTAVAPRNMIGEVINRIEAAQSFLPIGNRSIRLQLPVEGPYHLARLLSQVADVLLESAAIRIAAPGGVSAERWDQFAKYFATQRPFLWRNHLSAISQKFLESGTSFVLTFPTGAGKTTITELRIASELLRGRKVVYLAPTRALVDQVAADVSRTLRPIAPNVVRGRFLEDFGERAGARVFVQTPEQCLAYLSFEPDAHGDIGLIVVDECHQISGELPRANGEKRLPGRRAIDAMWTLLSLLQRSPEADVVLISAMVRNGAQLAEWLDNITAHPASLLDLAWKPTRQVRGVVAYEAEEVNALKRTLRTRRQARRGKPRPVDWRDLGAHPVGLFCHTQVWDAKSSFAKFPLLHEQVPLAVNKDWKLTANRNEVGGMLLSVMARAKMRPLVFSQKIDWTTRIADFGAADLEAAGVAAVALTDREQLLFQAAEAELGSASYVERPLRERVGVHHGLLLLPERLAMESAFRRPDGLMALVATPTVAQGINLPAEAVIIAGDDRWAVNATKDGPETLAVHELLNAAGRAGRAGHYAHGIVIDLPGKVFSVEQNDSGILDHAMGLFGLPDQCFDVVDPLMQVIDRIQHAGTDSDVGEYIVRRVAGLEDSVLVGMLAASFGNAFVTAKEQVALEQAAVLKAAALSLEEKDEGTDDIDPDEWREFASLTGTSAMAIATVAASIPAPETVAGWSFRDFLLFALQQLMRDDGPLFGLVDPGGSDLARIIPRQSRKTQDRAEFTESVGEWQRRWQAALREVLPMWLEGMPIGSIGDALHRHRRAKRRVKAKAIDLGRRFSLQTANGLAHGASLITLGKPPALPG
jgi:hypothetical protein